MDETPNELTDEELRRLSEIAATFEAENHDDVIVEIGNRVEQVASHMRLPLLRMLIISDARKRAQQNLSNSLRRYETLGEEAIGVAFSALNDPDANKTSVEDETYVDSLSDQPHDSLTNDTPSDDNEDPSLIRDSAIGQSTVIGKYRLTKLIGEGGMGTVWAAEQEKPVQRKVALKLIRSDIGSRRAIARFEAERQALAIMNHPNIAKVFDAGSTIHGSPYFVMELVDGVPITAYCDQHRLGVEERIRLMIPVCKAIQHAHQKGIIHRDLKPSNVLVAQYDGQPEPKVIDFGLAKALEQDGSDAKPDMTQLGQVVGTLRYMSPEQAGVGEFDLDTRTDIYSLGVILYELITGSTPLDESSFGRRAVAQIIDQIRDFEPAKPSSRLESSVEIQQVSRQRNIDPNRLKRMLQGDLDWVVMKALEKNRIRRYESVSGMTDDLERFLKNDTVAARPPSASYRISKFVVRNKGLVASIASLVSLLIAGVLFSSWFAYQANQAKIAFENKAASEEIQKNIAQRKTEEANQSELEAIAAKKLAQENEKQATDARNLAEQSERSAVEAQKSLASQLELAEIGKYAAELRQIQAIRQSGAAAEALNMMQNISPKFYGWEYKHLLANLRQEVTFQFDVSELDNFTALSVNSDFDSKHLYFVAKQLQRVDLATGKLTALFKPDVNDVCAIKISSDEKLIVITDLSKVVVYELETGKELFRQNVNYTWIVESEIDNGLDETANSTAQYMFLRTARLAPRMIDSNRLAISEKTGIKILDINNGAVIEVKIPEGIMAGFHYDEKQDQIVAWYSNTIALIDPSKSEIKNKISLKTPVLDVVTRSGNDELVVATSFNLIAIDRADFKILDQLEIAETTSIHSSNADPQGIYTLGRREGEVTRWSRDMHSPASRVLRSGSKAFTAFSISPTGEHFAFNDGKSWFAIRPEYQHSSAVILPPHNQATQFKAQSVATLSLVDNKTSSVGVYDTKLAKTVVQKFFDEKFIGLEANLTTETLLAISESGSKYAIVEIEPSGLNEINRIALNNQPKISSCGRFYAMTNVSVDGLQIKEIATNKLVVTIPGFEIEDEDPAIQELELLIEMDDFNWDCPLPTAFAVSNNHKFVYCTYSNSNEYDSPRLTHASLIGYQFDQSDQTKPALKIYESKAHWGETTSLQINASDDRLLGGGTGPSVKVWDATTGIELFDATTSLADIQGLRFDSDGSTLLVLGKNSIDRLGVGREMMKSVQPPAAPLAPATIEFLSSIGTRFKLQSFKRQSGLEILAKLEALCDTKFIYTDDFAAEFKDRKFWFKADSVESTFSRIIKGAPWNLVLVYDATNHSHSYLIVPSKLLATLPGNKISRKTAENISELDPWLKRHTSK